MPEAATAPETAVPATPAGGSPLPDNAPAKPGDNLNAAFADIDKLYVVPETPKGPPTDKAIPEPEKGGKKVADDAKPAAKPATAPKPEAKPDDKATDAGKVPERAKDLRAALDASKRSESDWRAKYEALKAESGKVKDDPEKKTMADRLEAADKRLKELTDELKYTNYERTQEYKDKYVTPFVDAYKSGRDRVSALKITETDAESGETKVRQATGEDFDALMRLTDSDAASDFALAKFGNKASLAMAQWEKLQDMNSARAKAVEDYRKNGSEREKLLGEQTAAQTKAFTDAFQGFNKSALDKFDWFKPREGDEKGNDLLEKGFKFADDCFNQELMSKVPVMDRAARFSALRNKAGGFDRLNHDNAQLRSQLSELQEKLKAYEESEPGPGEGKGKNKPAGKADDMDSVLAEMDKLVQ